jgi:tetratricopeptide (TPR) repeat protein
VTTSKRYLLQDIGKSVVQICESYLGIPLDQETRERLARPPTGSYKAFLAYAEGLLLEDEGQYAEAYEKYNAALDLDPGFAGAQAGADRVGGLGAGGEAISIGEGLPTTPAGTGLFDDAIETATAEVDPDPIASTQQPNDTNEVLSKVTIIIDTHGR